MTLTRTDLIRRALERELVRLAPVLDNDPHLRRLTFTARFDKAGLISSIDWNVERTAERRPVLEDLSAA